MKPEIQIILDRVKDTADFCNVDFAHVNATNVLGSNALHCVIVWGDYEAARVLIENGIDIQKHGEHGYTPLHEACAFGRKDIAELLLKHGANVLARTEGDLPFTTARLNSNDDICDLISRYMEGKSDGSLQAEATHMNALEKGISELGHKIGSCEIDEPGGKN